MKLRILAVTLLLQLCVVGFCLPVGSKAGDQGVTPLKYENGKTYKYSYKSSVTVDTPTPLKQGGGGKHVGIKLEAEVQFTPVWHGSEEQLVEILVSKPKIESVAHNGLGVDFKTFTQHPLYFHWANGRVEKVYVADKDNTLSANLKKGFAHMFQLQRDSGEAEEVDTSGTCLTKYHKEGEVLTKTKTDCRPLDTSGHCANSMDLLEVDFKSSVTSEYGIKDGIIQSAKASESHVGKLNLMKILGGLIDASQEITLLGTKSSSSAVSASSVAEAAKTAAKGRRVNSLESSLVTELEPQHCLQDCVAVSVMNKILNEERDNLLSEKMAQSTTGYSFIRLVRAFRRAGKDKILQVFRNAENSDILPQLVDVASAAQTSASQQALMEYLGLENSEIADSSLAERYLLSASHSTHPTEDLLQDLLKLYKKGLGEDGLQQSLGMALASTVHTYCKSHAHRKDKIVSDIQAAFLDKLAACTDDECRLLILQPLANAGLPGTVMELVRLAEDSPEFRVQQAAVDALQKVNPKVFTSEIKQAMSRIYHQNNNRTYDTTIRTSALDLLLKMNPTYQELQNILLAASDTTKSEMSRYVLSKLRVIAKDNERLRKLLFDVLKNQKVNNINNMAHKGLSGYFKGHYINTPSLEATYSMFLESANSGILKRGGLIVDIGDENKSMQLLKFGMFAQALESLIGDTPEPGTENLDPTAGMQLSIMGTSFRPIQFFRGSGELMSAVWSAPSELTTALQLNILLHDHMERIHLQNGLILEHGAMGAISIDLSGLVSISLWNRNSHSLVKNSGSLAVKGSLKIVNVAMRTGVDYGTDAAAVIEFTTDSDFYEMPLKLCLQMMQPGFVYNQSTLKYEHIKGVKKGYEVKNKKAMYINGKSYLLPPPNSEQCRVLLAEES